MPHPFEALHARVQAAVSRRNEARARLSTMDVHALVDLAVARELREAEAELAEVWAAVGDAGEAYAEWVLERE